jgi:hypothetical protein
VTLALAIGLAALSATLAAFVITQGIWLHSANKERDAIVDNLDGQRKLVAEYKGKYDTETVAHTVTTTKLKEEQELRAAAVKQRDDALAKCRAYLARTLEGGTKDDINAVLADLFAPHLSVVPKPEARLSDSGDTALLDPFAEV